MATSKTSIADYMSGLSSIIEGQIEDVKDASAKALADIQHVVDTIKQEAGSKIETIGQEVNGKFETLKKEILSSINNIEAEFASLKELIHSNSKDTELVTSRIKRVEEKLNSVSKLLKQE